MRRLLAFAGGILSGTAVGTAIALLFTPASGGAMRQGLRQRYANAIQAGQSAADAKRAELATKYTEMTSANPPSSD